MGMIAWTTVLCVGPFQSLPAHSCVLIALAAAVDIAYFLTVGAGVFCCWL